MVTGWGSRARSQRGVLGPASAASGQPPIYQDHPFIKFRDFDFAAAHSAAAHVQPTSGKPFMRYVQWHPCFANPTQANNMRRKRAATARSCRRPRTPR
eukprot:5868231-Prymnesium_polylepis.1